MTTKSSRNFELECACRYCEHEELILVDEKDYDAWHNGEPAQNVFDYLTDDQRELIIRNTCGPCFDNFFPPDDEE